MRDIEETVNHCPVELSLELITKKWVIQLIRDMFFGKTHFNEFKENKKISNKVLSKCLKQMETDCLIVKNEEGNSTNYQLTEKGKALNKVIYDLEMYTVNTDKYNHYYNDETKKKIKNVFKRSLIYSF